MDYFHTKPITPRPGNKIQFVTVQIKNSLEFF